MTGKLQACTLRRVESSLAMLAVIYVAGFVYFARQDMAAFIFWIVFLPLLEWANLRFLPRLRSLTGSGRAADRLPADLPRVAGPAGVTLYTALGCPYCPLVHRRLEWLRETMGFSLTIVDLTLHPQLAAERAIQSVPSVEVRGGRLTGNATAEQLTRFIAGEA